MACRAMRSYCPKRGVPYRPRRSQSASVKTLEIRSRRPARSRVQLVMRSPTWHCFRDFDGPVEPLRSVQLRNLIAVRGLAEERCAQLRRALLRLEVYVHQPETIAESLSPLEVVHRAPLEVALHWHAVRGRPLELRQ